MKFALVRTYVRTFVCSFVLCTLARAPRVPWIPLIPYSVDDVAKSHETSHFPFACELSTTKHFTLQRSHQTFYRFYYCYYFFFYYSQLPCFLFPFVCFSLSGSMVSLQQGMVIVGDLFMIIQANLGNWKTPEEKIQSTSRTCRFLACPEVSCIVHETSAPTATYYQKYDGNTSNHKHVVSRLFLENLKNERIYTWRLTGWTRRRVQAFLARQKGGIWLVTNNRDNDFYHELRST